MAIATVNPATGETLRSFPELADDEIRSKIELAQNAFEKYRTTRFGERAEKLNRAADILEDAQREFARTISLEMGKPISASIAEVGKCASACRYYAEHGESFLHEEVIASGARRSYVLYQPLGIVLAIMPWNFPFWQVFRFAAPALMAGNVGLLKHSSNVPQCSLAIEEILMTAGFSSGVFQSLLISSAKVDQVIRDPRVKAVTLTGSEGAGRSVGAAAGHELKKVVLELGGSDPFIVMPSANIEQAAKIGVKARTVNSGQSCIAAKRFIVHQEVAEEFQRRFVEETRALKVGDPMSDQTEVGPLATPQIVADIEKQVNETVGAGAKILTGGSRSRGDGNFFEPTVLTNVPRHSAAASEETFGPVAPIFVVGSLEEAIDLANDIPFGLGASAWTNDTREQQEFAERIEAGQVFINAMVASDPRLPFGGIKSSGFGRELGPHGIREFVNVKTIYIADVPRAKKTE
jgi:succinate-semialdehyde dehydrogenase/glutarate-semialdehyde dehydrogenase